MYATPLPPRCARRRRIRARCAPRRWPLRQCACGAPEDSRALPGEGRAGSFALRRDGNKARLEPGDALADRCFRGRGVRRSDPAALFFLPRRAQVLVGPCRRRLALGHVVGETLDLLVDADDLRREIGTLIGRRAERRLVPAQCASAELVANRLVLIPLGSLIAERLDSRTDLAKDVVHPDQLRVRELHSLECLFAA